MMLALNSLIYLVTCLGLPIIAWPDFPMYGCVDDCVLIALDLLSERHTVPLLDIASSVASVNINTWRLP